MGVDSQLKRLKKIEKETVGDIRAYLEADKERYEVWQIIKEVLITSLSSDVKFAKELRIIQRVIEKVDENLGDTKKITKEQDKNIQDMIDKYLPYGEARWAFCDELYRYEKESESASER